MEILLGLLGEEDCVLGWPRSCWESGASLDEIGHKDLHCEKCCHHYGTLERKRVELHVLVGRIKFESEWTGR